MSTRERTMSAAPDQVWDVLADGWLYPLFVVGAARMRDVDRSWPARGARLHHSVGSWPLMLDDSTEVLESRPGELLRLRARGWPSGEAEVVFELAETDEGTTVTLHEDVVSGPARLIPRPVRAPQIGLRNGETLRRLTYLVEGRR